MLYLISFSSQIFIHKVLTLRRNSKFGTYTILDKKEGKDLDTPEGGNSSETDDATDDESPGSSQQSTPSSKYIERKIPKDENYILHSLSLPLNKDDDAEEH